MKDIKLSAYGRNRGLIKSIHIEQPEEVSQSVKLKSVVRTPSIIENIQVVNLETDESKPRLIKIRTDVDLLLNQDRIVKTLGADVANQFIQSLASASGTQIPSNVSDQQLFDSLKSRYVQSPMELKQWIESCSSQQAQIIRDYVNGQIEVEQAKAAKSEPAPVASPAAE